MLSSPSRARREPPGCQVMDLLVDQGYRSNVVEAMAGTPTRLVFHRDADDRCSERVVSSSPRIDPRLAAAGTTTIEPSGQVPGRIRFACGRGLHRGQTDILDGDRRSRRQSLGRWLALGRGPGGAQLALAISLIPAVALLSLVDFSGPGGLTLAAAALAGWVAVCRWAGRYLAHST